MRKLHVRSVASLLGVLAVCGVFRNAQARTQVSTQGIAIEANVCELAAFPERYDGKLVRLEAFISREFEDSTLHDPSCPEEALVNGSLNNVIRAQIWTEFADDVGYSHVTGYAPLVSDEQLGKLRTALKERAQKHQMTSADMIGTFYAGKPRKVSGHVTSSRGFGHGDVAASS